MAGVQPAKLQSLEWRCAGPHRGGRVVAVAGCPRDPATFYFGACAGGVWKSTDAGTYWECVSDGYLTTSAVGAIQVSDSDPNVIYVGTGETAIRGNVSHGDGVYKSTDAGKSWQNVGLKATRHISKIRIHPTNPDLVYVAALGDAWGPNRERGVFRSTDGGKHWDQILYKSENAGAIDLTVDPTNPRVLYATIWNGRRGPNFLVSGSEECGIWRSLDGGDTWQDISRGAGLPKGLLGKIGIAAAPKAGRVYAIVEAEDGAVFCSDDYGATWQRRSEEGGLRWRAWYYHHIYADPTNADTIWVLDLKCWKSIDGGKTFTDVGTPHGDNHDLWIDPRNSNRVIQGNDGGANVSFNGGASFTTIYNQPTAQFYHVITDNQQPYRIYGSQQDNSAITIPSFSSIGCITESEWYVPGGGESGYIAIRPDNPNIVYAGAIGSGPGHGRLIRYDHASKQQKNITAWPEMHGMGHGAKDLKYRFQWTYPIELSPHDPNTLYACCQKVLRTRDEGVTWEEISPDLTRNDPSKMQPSGGPITKDNTGAETYCTIFAFFESKFKPGVFWAGTDDGLVHRSTDNGQSWTNVTPTDLPEWSLISILEPSPHDPDTVYLAATRYKDQDRRPYLYKTNNAGQSWTKIVGGLPHDDFTRTIREDPNCRGLLYCGTELGVYVSFDDGGNWQPLQLNLPVCPIHDLHVKDTDLIAATHGRSFWVLDDLSPLHQIARGELGLGVALARPRTAVRWKNTGRAAGAGAGKQYRRIGPLTVTYTMTQKPNGEWVETLLDAGKNPPDGAIIHYYLPNKPNGEVKLRLLDSAGATVRSFSSETGDLKLPVAVGANRFLWNLRHDGALALEGDPSLKDAGVLNGPVVAPGQYTAELTVGSQVLRQTFEVKPDPRAGATQADYVAQVDLLLKIRDKVTATHTALHGLRQVRSQVEAAEARSGGQAAVTEAGQALRAKLSEIESTVTQLKAGSPLQFPFMLNQKLGMLTAFVSSADGAPTASQYEFFTEISAKIDAQLANLKAVIDTDLAAFNALATAQNVPVVNVPAGVA